MKQGYQLLDLDRRFLRGKSFLVLGRFTHQLHHTEWNIKTVLLCLAGAKGYRKQVYTSYLFLSSTLDGGEWSASRPGHILPPGTGIPVPLVQEAGWASEQVWTQARGKILSVCQGSNLGCPVCSQTLY
jgi:hypothetical protein